MVRFAVGVGLLVSYVIYGLTFRNLIHHAYFAMTMAIFVFIGSFIVDLQKEQLQDDALVRLRHVGKGKNDNC